jgi:7-cyano-7-deazaguanine reductase
MENGMARLETFTNRHPGRRCVELKSLKLYLQAYRTQGIFYEAVVNVILDDLVSALSPRRLTVEGDFRVRGGISSVVTATYEAPVKGRGRTR